MYVSHVEFLFSWIYSTTHVKTQLEFFKEDILYCWHSNHNSLQVIRKWRLFKQFHWSTLTQILIVRHIHIKRFVSGNWGFSLRLYKNYIKTYLDKTYLVFMLVQTWRIQSMYLVEEFACLSLRTQSEESSVVCMINDYCIEIMINITIDYAYLQPSMSEPLNHTSNLRIQTTYQVNFLSTTLHDWPYWLETMSIDPMKSELISLLANRIEVSTEWRLSTNQISIRWGWRVNDSTNVIFP